MPRTKGRRPHQDISNSININQSLVISSSDEDTVSVRNVTQTSQKKNNNNQARNKRRRQNRTESTTSKNKTGSTRSINRSKSNPSSVPFHVINLDGASSSEDDTNTTVKISVPVTIKPLQHSQFSLSPSPKEKIASLSDSDDCLSDSSPAKNCVINKSDDLANDYSYDEDFDIFAVNYSAQRKMAIKEAAEDLAHKSPKKICKEPNINKNKNKRKSIQLEDIITDTPETVAAKSKELLLSSPLLLDLEEDYQLPSHQKIKINRKTRQALHRFEQISQQIAFSADKNENVNANSISDTIPFEEETNPEVTVRIKWGTEFIHLNIRKLQKFSCVYQQLADRFAVSVSQVILCHRDTIVRPEMSPADIGLTIADTIEGGIKSSGYHDKIRSFSKVDEINQDPDSIGLKVQNNNKKGTVIIYISRFDKMIVLMHKYADEKNAEVGKLRFQFDGEKLDKDETPETLDLEGGECIDVHEIE